MSKNLTIGDILDTISITHTFNKDELIFLNTSDVLEGKILTNAYMPISEMKGQAKKTIQNGDILFSEIRPKNKRYAYVDVTNPEDYIVSTKLMVLRNKTKDVLTKYIYYFLTYEDTLNYLQMRAENRICSFPQITFDVIKSLAVRVPSLPQQRKIINIISALDNKIELNNRINTELENLAKTIYDYWFVQFDFPDKNGKPYKASGGKMVYNQELKRSIPKGWEVKRLGEVLTIVRGASPRPICDFLSDKGLPWIKISDATSSNNRFINETKQFIIKEGIQNTRHIQPDTLILSNSATPGLPRIVKIEAGVHDGWLIISDYTNGLTQEFMYHYFSYEYLRIICLGNGSIFKNLKTDYVKDLKIVLPPKNLLDKATSKFKAISELIYVRVKENQQLTELRDWLLPMLMNGQVTVK